MAFTELWDKFGRAVRSIVTNESEDGTGTFHHLLSDTSGNLKVKAASNTGVDIGDVDVLSIAAGTNVIGKTLPARTIVETQFSATASMVVGTHKLAPGVAYKVVAIEIHNSAAPSTGTQNLVLTLDNGSGSAYDVTLLSLDMVANAITDLRFTPEELLCKATDVITASLINSDAVTWGLCFKHEVTG